MTPKQRVINLIEKISQEIRTSNFHVPEFITGVPCADGSKEYTDILSYETELLAKNCAIIAVKEIMDIDNKYGYEYWKEVKVETKKIKSQIGKINDMNRKRTSLLIHQSISST